MLHMLIDVQPPPSVAAEVGYAGPDLVPPTVLPPEESALEYQPPASVFRACIGFVQADFWLELAGSNLELDMCTLHPGAMVQYLGMLLCTVPVPYVRGPAAKIAAFREAGKGVVFCGVWMRRRMLLWRMRMCRLRWRWQAGVVCESAAGLWPGFWGHCSRSGWRYLWCPWCPPSCIGVLLDSLLMTMGGWTMSRW